MTGVGVIMAKVMKNNKTSNVYHLCQAYSHILICESYYNDRWLYYDFVLNIKFYSQL